MNGYCYVMKIEGVYKFGFTRDPEKRRVSLCKSGGVRAELLGAVKATFAQEREMHRLLEPFRIEGEFYTPCNKILEIVKLFPAYIPKEVKKHRNPRNSNQEHKTKARMLLEQMIDRRETIMSELNRIGLITGIGPRRIRAIWNNEARMIELGEMQALEDAVAPHRPMDR